MKTIATKSHILMR